MEENTQGLEELFLNEEEYERRLYQYNKEIRQYFSFYKQYTQQEYTKIVKEKNNSKEAKNEYIKMCLCVAAEGVVEFFLTYKVRTMELMDALSETYLNIHDFVNKLEAPKYLAIFKFFVQKKIQRDLMNIVKKNYLNVCLSTDLQIQEGNSIEDFETAELLPDEKTIQEDDSRRIRLVLRMLDPREQVIIIKKYGLNDNVTKSSREVGELYNVSHQHISKIEKEAINKLRAKFTLLS